MSYRRRIPPGEIGDRQSRLARLTAAVTDAKAEARAMVNAAEETMWREISLQCAQGQVETVVVPVIGKSRSQIYRDLRGWRARWAGRAYSRY